MLDNIGYLPIVLVIVAVIVMAKAMITVPQGYEYTLEKFGRYKRTMEPGLHFIMPFFEARMPGRGRCSRAPTPHDQRT